MISILLFCCSLSLSAVSVINAQQQTQLVYEQHFVDGHNNNHFPQNSHANYYQQSQQNLVQQYPSYQQQQPHPQYAQHQHHQQPQHQGYGVFPNAGHHQTNQMSHQPIPMFQAMPSLNSEKHQQQPAGGFMQRMGFLQQPGPSGMPPHEFSSRRGPKSRPPPMKRRGKPPPKSRRGKKPPPGAPIKMMDMHRIPKPPKYPLYDMGSLGLATPPPPPVMHPMAQVPSESNTYSTYVKSPRGGRPPPPNHPKRRGGGKPRRGPPPKKPSGKRGRRPPPPNHLSRNHRKPPPGDKHSQGYGFDHPMASNLDPLVDSPPLGRPLSYDEYMERPSHSFTNDPWNFDPYAAKYNSGMNTYAMKYNYDPLGMNNLDKSQSHLDPNKLSYPGDYYTHGAGNTPGIDESPHETKSSQIGGWDQPPESYRSPQTSILPPPKSGISSGSSNKKKYPSPAPSRSSQNSFNTYDDNLDGASNVHSTAMDPLKLLQDANPGMEFSIESADGSDSNLRGSSGSNNGDSSFQQNSQFYSEQLHNTEPMFTESQWGNYPIEQQPYQSNNGGGSFPDVSMTHDDVIFDQSSQGSHPQQTYQQPYSGTTNNNGFPHQTSPARHDYENSPSSYTYDDDGQMNRRKQDYANHEAPSYSLSDHYSPSGGGSGGDLTRDMMPPNQGSHLFKRSGTGARSTRQEHTPMVELEGLSLLKDILHNENALATRQQLFRVL